MRGRAAVRGYVRDGSADRTASTVCSGTRLLPARTARLPNPTTNQVVRDFTVHRTTGVPPHAAATGRQPVAPMHVRAAMSLAQPEEDDC